MKLMFFSVLFTLLVCSCSEEKLIDREIMVDTYVNIMLRQEIYKNFQDSLQVKLDEVFEKNNISEEEYLRTLNSYSGDKESWDSFFSESLAYLDSLRSKINAEKPSTSPGRYESSSN